MLRVRCTRKNGYDQYWGISCDQSDSRRCFFVILFACFVRQAGRVHKGCQSNQLENSRKFSFFSDITTCSSLRCLMPHVSQVPTPTCCIAALEDILNIIQLLHILHVWSFFWKPQQFNLISMLPQEATVLKPRHNHNNIKTFTSCYWSFFVTKILLLLR